MQDDKIFQGEKASSVGGEEQVKRRNVSGSRSLGITSATQQCGVAMLYSKRVSPCDCYYDIMSKNLLLVDLVQLN